MKVFILIRVLQLIMMKIDFVKKTVLIFEFNLKFVCINFNLISQKTQKELNYYFIHKNDARFDAIVNS